MSEAAFWHTSATIPLCLQQNGTGTGRRYLETHHMVVWWATAVEMRSALARLARMNQVTAADYIQARLRAEDLRRSWREIQPCEPLRHMAESLLDRFPLQPADSLQLAAALMWCRSKTRNRAFLCGDEKLNEAASSLGFEVVKA